MTKNFKGGYKIVSLNGNDLTSESAFTIKGIYEDLRDSYSKPILVTEIVIDDEKQQDAYAVVKKTESGYTIDVYDYALTVTDEDAVTSEAIVKGITSIDGYEGEVTLGEGLSLTEEGELSATGGGGGGADTYQHFIEINGTHSGVTFKIYFTLISTKNTQYTAISDVLDDLYASKVSSGVRQLPIVGIFGTNGHPITMNVTESKPTSGFGINCITTLTSTNQTETYVSLSEVSSINDFVHKI